MSDTVWEMDRYRSIDRPQIAHNRTVRFDIYYENICVALMYEEQ